ncbi:hypothetical protein Taro_004220, partial [Colocasia esculenta]|nr:hypothetical protein [Colocasia esculenta]
MNRKLCSTRRENSSPSHRYGCTNIADILLESLATPQFGIGTSNRSAQGQNRRFPVRHPNSSPRAWSRATDASAYGRPSTQTSITFRSVIEITYKTPIRNRHSEALVALYSLSNVSIYHVNPGRSSHTESACHGNRKFLFNSARELLPKS